MPRCAASARATATETPPRVPSVRRVTRTGFEAISAARNLPVGHNVAAAELTCACALAASVHAVVNAVIATATASLRVHIVHPQCGNELPWTILSQSAGANNRLRLGREGPREW